MEKLPLALSKAQAAIPAPQKKRKVDFIDKQGRRVHYNYADLSDVIECIRKALADNELSVVHRLEYAESGYGMRTELWHSSGEMLSTWYPLPDPQGIKAQEFGSAITYARRYSISALLGIASEEDDDGAEANEIPTHKPDPSRSPVKPNSKTEPLDSKDPKAWDGIVSYEQLKRLRAIAQVNSWTDEDIKFAMNQEWGVDSSKKLTHEMYDLLITHIQGAGSKKPRDTFNDVTAPKSDYENMRQDNLWKPDEI